MQKVRVANPGPAGLLVINPKRGKSMATKRRRRSATAATTKRRRTTRRKSNPTTYASTKRRSITRSRRRSVSRRRNPSTGMFAEAGTEALILVGLGLLSPLLPPIGGISPLATAGRQAGLGYLLGEAMERFNFGRVYGRSVKKIGLLMGGVTLVNAYIAPMVAGFLRPAPKAQPATNGNSANGMGDIVTLPRGEWDSYYGSTPMFNTNPGSGMNGLNGVVTIPRRATGY